VRVWKDTAPGRLRVQYNGQAFEGLIPRRPFPISRPQFIILSEKDTAGAYREVLMLRDYSQLDQESRNALELVLEKTYFVPRVLRVEQLETSGDEFQWRILSDKGHRAFNTRGRRNIMVIERRIVIIDTSDNIYLIPDYHKLDQRSRRLLHKFI